MDVHGYIEAAGARRWRWGHVDCTLFAGDWALAKCGRDPGADIRGTYSDEAGASALVEAGGGMLPFIDGCLAAIDWERVDEPEDGDIGVVEAPLAPLGHMGLIPAIRAGGLWVIRTRRGYRAATFKLLAAWRG